MSKITCTFLDFLNHEEIEQYERNLFRAFYSDDIVVLDRIWNFDTAARRARLPVPLKDQTVIVAKESGMIVAGGAFNFNMKTRLQLEMIGFEIDKSEPGTGEGLAIFNNRLVINGNSLALILRDFIFDHLKKNNIRKIYGTCNKRKLRGYKFLGFEEIDVRNFDRGNVYLIEKRVDN